MMMLRRWAVGPSVKNSFPEHISESTSFQSEFNTQGRRGENDDVTALGRWAVRKKLVSGAYL